MSFRANWLLESLEVEPTSSQGHREVAGMYGVWSLKTDPDLGWGGADL